MYGTLWGPGSLSGGGWEGPLAKWRLRGRSSVLARAASSCVRSSSIVSKGDPPLLATLSAHYVDGIQAACPQGTGCAGFAWCSAGFGSFSAALSKLWPMLACFELVCAIVGTLTVLTRCSAAIIQDSGSCFGCWSKTLVRVSVACARI